MEGYIKKLEETTNYLSSKLKQYKQDKDKLKEENTGLLEMIHRKNDLNEKVTLSWKWEIKKRKELEEKVKGATVFIKTGSL